MQAKLIDLGNSTNINRPAFTIGDLETDNRPNTKRIRYSEMTKLTSPTQETNTEYSRPKRLCSVKSTPVLTQISQNTTDKKTLLESLNIIEPQAKPVSTRPLRTSPTKPNRMCKNSSFNDLNKIRNKSTSSLSNTNRNSFTCLRNLGSTCYINCIIQVMRYTPGFVLSINRLNKQIEYLKSLKNPEIDTELNRNNDIAFVKHLHELLVDMAKIEKSDRRPIYTPRKFVNTVWTLLSFWSDGSQQDAHEFLQYTIHFINECDLLLRKIQAQYQLKQTTPVKEQSQCIYENTKKRPVRKMHKSLDTDVFMNQNPLLLVTDESSSSSTSSTCSSSASSTSAVSAPIYKLKSIPKINPVNMADTNFLRTPTKGGASSFNLSLLESNLNSKKDTEEELIFRPMIKSENGDLTKREPIKVKIQIDKSNEKYKIASPVNKKTSPILIDNNDLVSKRLKETLNSSCSEIKPNAGPKRYQANSLNDSDSVIIMDSDGDDDVYFMDDNEVLHPIDKQEHKEDLVDIKNCFVLLEKIDVESIKNESKPQIIQENNTNNKNIKKLRTKSKTFPAEIESINNDMNDDIDAITCVSSVRSYNSSKSSSDTRKLRSKSSSQNLRQLPIVPLSTPPSPAELLRKYSAGPGYTCEMDKLFKGSSVTVTQCLECENLRKCPESFYDRSIPLETTENEDESSCWIAKCLSNESYLNENSKYMCDQCASKQEAKIQTLYTQMPSILILHLLSYGITSSDDGNLNTRKLSNRLRLVNYFDFKTAQIPKISRGNDAPKYQFKLFAVVMHSGVSLNSGHYTAFINYKIICQNVEAFEDTMNLKPNSMDENEKMLENGHNTEWLHFDDTKVKTLTNNEFQRKILDSNYDSPYILFYVRE